MTEDKAKEGTENVEGKEGTSHPENVPWNQYVGVKEKLSKTETRHATELKERDEKIQSLEEQLRNAPTKEEHDRIKAELEAKTGELQSFKDKSVSEKREALKRKGVPEEEVNKMSEDALEVANRVLEQYKPKPDMGGGGGKAALTGSPSELARRAYSK